METIILVSGLFSGGEVHGKSSSVTSHCIPRNMNAMFYVFAILNSVPFGQLYIEQVWEQYFNDFEHPRKMERV